MLTRNVTHHTYDVDGNGHPWARNAAAHWTRGSVVRTAMPVFALPPRKIAFDATDPLTFAVKGAGYRPYR